MSPTDDRARVLAASDYETFRERLVRFDCRLCRLHEGRDRLVVDRGAPGARVALIGEAPGAEEDRAGQAFVGRSGRLLDEMLAEAGLDPRSDILIFNVAKCRPPENRAPKPDEVASCFPWLERQLRLATPEVVVLLGATAIRHVLPEHRRTRVGDLVGEVVESERWPGLRFVATFHPAFILRSRSKRPVMVDHLRRIVALLSTTR